MNIENDNDFVCIYVKDEPFDEILDTKNNTETILTSIKKETKMNIDMNLLSTKPTPVPILIKPPPSSSSSNYTSNTLKSPTETTPSQQFPIHQHQQSIPIISITNFNSNLTDPRIDHQNKHLQNQLKKLFVFISANNHQQIKFNNSVNTDLEIQLSYDSTDLKSQVEFNIRTSLIKFTSQLCLAEYFDLTRQLEYIFIDLALLQEKVCTNHIYLNDLYEYINEIKLVLGVRLKKFFKMNQLPDLFQKIFTQINVPTRLQRVSPVDDIRDPRLRKQQQQQQSQQQQSSTVIPTSIILNKKYLLDLKFVKYNLSNETPKSPNSPKISPIQQNNSKKKTIISNNKKNDDDISQQITDICENIQKNVLNNNTETSLARKEKCVEEILTFFTKLLKKHIEEPNENNNTRKHRHNESRSGRKRNRSRSSYRHHSDKRKSRSRSRSRERHHSRKHYSSSRHSRDKRVRASSSSKSSTPIYDTAAAITNNNNSTKFGLKIVYDSESIQQQQHATIIDNIENIPLPEDLPPSMSCQYVKTGY
jgi:hypothetical protein